MLLDTAKRRGALAATAAMDKGYDNGKVHGECAERDCLPVIPLKEASTVKRGEHLPPRCEHGEWKFAGADRKRGAAKWRCPTGECAPASTWRKASRLHPRSPTSRIGGGGSTEAAARSSGSSDDSSTNGVFDLYEFVALSASDSTPT